MIWEAQVTAAGRVSTEDTSHEDARLTGAAGILGHPLRVSILEEVNEHEEMSPSQFYASGAAGPDYELNLISYHFRALAKAGYLAVVERIPGRQSNTVTTIYRGLARAYFSDEEWASMPLAKRREISRTMAGGLMARIDGALLADTFDSRIDRHLVWQHFKIDEQGWRDLAAIGAETWESVADAMADAEGRLAGSEDPPLHVTFGYVSFESPSPSSLEPG